MEEPKDRSTTPIPQLPSSVPSSPTSVASTTRLPTSTATTRKGSSATIDSPDLRKQLRGTKSELESKKLALADLEHRLSTAKRDAATKDAEIARLEAAFEQANQDAKMKFRRCQELQNENNELEAKVRKALAESTVANERVEEAEEEADQKRLEIESLQAEMEENLQRAKDEFDLKLKDIATKLRETQALLKQKTEELDSIRTRNNEERSRHSRELSTLGQEHAAELEGLREGYRGLIEEVELAKKENERLRKEVEGGGKKGEEAKTALEGLKKEMAEMWRRRREEEQAIRRKWNIDDLEVGERNAQTLPHQNSAEGAPRHRPPSNLTTSPHPHPPAPRSNAIIDDLRAQVLKLTETNRELEALSKRPPNPVPPPVDPRLEQYEKQQKQYQHTIHELEKVIDRKVGYGETIVGLSVRVAYLGLVRERNEECIEELQRQIGGKEE